jgi:hypothetical protein
MMNPEDIGRDGVDAAGLHLQELIAPFGPGVARVVKLPYYRNPGLAIQENERLSAVSATPCGLLAVPDP